MGVVRGIAHRITDADDAFLAMIGHARADLAAGALDWRALTPPEFAHLDDAGMQQSRLGGGFTVPYRKQFVRPDGSRVSVLLMAGFLPGETDRWIGFAIDISQPLPVHRAVDAPDTPLAGPLPRELFDQLAVELVRERQRMIAMLDNTDELIWAVDTECRLLSANRAFQVAQRGVSGRDMEIGEALLGPQYPEEFLRPWRAWYARALEGARFRTQSTHVIDGATVHSEHRFSPIVDETQQVIGATVLSADVTARRQSEDALRDSEARFRTITDSSPLGIFLTDATGGCIYTNPRLSSIWGVDQLALRGFGYADGIHPDDRDAAMAEWRVAVEGGTGIESQFRVRRPDGSERHVRIWAAPLRLDNVISGFAGSIEDDTEVREIAARLRQRDKMESLGTLAGGVAHDFNNMLGIVLGHTELAIAEQNVTPALREHLGEIRTASVRARDLVQQILTFSRRSEREQSPVDLRALVAESVKLLRSAFPQSIRIDTNIASAPIAVMGDATALQQIIVNLCTNAEHAMRAQGDGVLTVSLVAQGTAPDGHAILTVQDTGSGMSAEVKRKAFEPFFTTKSIGEGTGMGLAVVHGLVASYGGGIALDSTPGIGTTVRVALPLTAGVESAPATVTAVPRGSGAVLLAEDEPALARFAERALQRSGYVVTVCRDGASALERFTSAPHDFDIVVTDLTMPGLAGDRLAMEIKRLRPDTPVVLMTGFSRTLTTRNAHEFGIDALLDKPFSAKDLVATVASVLSR